MSAADNLSPQQVFHGTSESHAKAIETRGLRPSDGVWHVTSDIDYASDHARDQQALGRGRGAALFAVDLNGIPTEPGTSGEAHHRIGRGVIPPERLRRVPLAPQRVWGRLE